VNFLLDYDVPDDVVYSLIELGHEVQKLHEALPATASDQGELGIRRNIKFT
jgi:hypothetical protein